MKNGMCMWGAVLLAAEAAAVLTLPGLPAGGQGYAAAMAICIVVMAATVFWFVRAASDALRSTHQERLSQQKEMQKELADLLQQQGQLLEEHLHHSEETLQAELKRMRETYDGMERQLAEASSRNVQELSDACSNALSESIQALTQGNAAMLDRQTEAYRENLAATAAQYDAVIAAHAAKLEQQIEAQIRHFVEVNHSAFEENATRVRELVTAESDFLTASEKNNLELHTLISDCLRTYGDASQKAIHDLGQQMNDNAGSALQKLHKAEEKNLQDLLAQTKIYLKNLEQELHAHGVENADLFNRSMEDYRERFVDANAHALAKVQDGTMQMVANANEKVADLADDLGQTNANLRNLKGLIQCFVTELQDHDRKALETQQEFQEEMSDDFEDFRKDMVKAVDTQLGKYNNSLGALDQSVQKVMKAVQENTADYQGTLAQIQKTQTEMNTLTKQDIELMKKLLR